MADVVQQPGLLSDLLYAIETTPGTLATPTDILEPESFQVTDDPNIEQFPVMRASRNVIQGTRAGVHKVMVSATAPFFAIQGGALWRALVGFDTIYPAAAPTTTTLASAVAAAGTSLSTVASIPALSFISIDTGGLLETMKTGTPSGAGPFTIPITGDGTANGTQFAHATGTTVTVAQSGVSASASVGATTVSVTTLPALPGGIADYLGTNIQVGQNFKTILGISGAGPYTLTVTALTAALTTNDAALVNQTHVIQEYTVAGTRHQLATVSLYAQFAAMMEWQLPYGFMSKGGLKGDNKQLKEDWGFNFGALPTPTGTLTSFTPTASEAGDSPWIMRDGGLVTPFATTDPAPLMHSRPLSLDWELDNGLEARIYGGGVQNTEFYVAGERKYKFSFKEDAGQHNATPDIWTNYVKTQAKMPAFVSLVNAGTNNMFSVYHPNCRVIKYDPITSMNEPIGYQGDILPLQDSTTGYSVKVCLTNGTNVAY